MNEPRMKWLEMDMFPPLSEQEVLFIAEDGISNEKIGIAVPEKKIIILRRTEISFSDVLYWLPIPKLPTSAECPTASEIRDDNLECRS